MNCHFQGAEPLAFFKEQSQRHFSWHSVMRGCLPVLLCAMANFADRSNYTSSPRGPIAEIETEEPSAIVWNEPLIHSDSLTFVIISDSMAFVRSEFLYDEADLSKMIYDLWIL